MTDDRRQQIEQIYLDALDVPAANRPRFLDRACEDDRDLRSEVEAFLALQPDAEGFLEQPAIESAARTLAEILPALRPPEIPGYRIIRHLGEGGMGLVYLAEQEAPLRRLVALKVIKPGMDSRQVVARFNAERQALAQMDHPNIAAVYDAGATSDGRPFFVMEFVDGLPISEYCDRKGLPTIARLDLFTLVCAAVQHAHQKGVIHRDLKPSNVLVAEQDGRPIPKVIDFGTAKAIDRSASGSVTLTAHGMVLGTIEYMSPEQAAFSRDIDTRTDVYSLGVMLYELLVGVLPFERPHPGPEGYDELRRLIRESDPLRPSTRLSAIADSRAAIASARQTDPDRLRRSLQGDLDWIALKALEKDRTRRYPTVAAFEADVHRFLQDEPVEARPPSTVYRIGKFVRRYRGAVAASAAVLVVLIAGLSVSTLLYLWAGRALADAEDQAYVATIAAADGELRANAPALARARLLAVPEARRQWEWQHLFRRTDSSAAILKPSSLCVGEPPSALLTSCRSPVCSYLGADRALVVDTSQIYLMRCSSLDRWDLFGLGQATYRASGTILGVGSRGAVVLNRASRPGEPSVWELSVVDIAADQTIATIGPFQRQPDCLDVSADGARIAVGFGPSSPSVAAAYEVWNVGSGDRAVRLMAPMRNRARDWELNCTVVFSPDASRVASSDRAVNIWEVASGRLIESDPADAQLNIQPIAFSPNGAQLAVGRESGLVDLIEPASGELPRHFDAGGLVRSPPPVRDPDNFLATFRRQAAVLSLAFSPDGRRIVSGGSLGVGIWDVAVGRLAHLLFGHTSPVTGVAVAPDGRVISSDVRGEVRVWSEHDTGGVTRLPGPSIIFGQLSLSADGNSAASAEFDGGLSTWQLDTLEHRVLRKGVGRQDPGGRRTSYALNPDGSRLFFAEADEVGPVRIWDTQSGTSSVAPENAKSVKGCEEAGVDQGFGFFKSGPGFPDVMAFSPDSQTFAHSRGNCILVRNSLTMEILSTYREYASALSFLPDGRLLLVSVSLHDWPQGPTRIRIWNWRENRIVAELRLPHRSGRRFAAASPDGQRIAVLGGERGRVVLIWNSTLNREIGQLEVPEGTLGVAFSSDGRRLVTTGRDTTLRVWDTEHLRQLLILDDTDQHTTGAAFTPDGRVVALRDAGGLTIWETRRR